MDSFDPYNGEKPGLFQSWAKPLAMLAVLFAIAALIVWFVS